MTHIEKLSIPSSHDQLPLGATIVRPEGQPVGILQLAHGMSEHRERYLPLMEYAAGRGYVCIVHDHRGHGQSVRTKGDLGYFYAGGADAMLCDMRQISLYATELYPSIPLYLMGHSMGALTARAYAVRWGELLSGLIVCGCPSRNAGAGAAELLTKLMMRIRGGRARSKLLRFATVGAFARVIKGAATEFDWLSSDADVVRAYIDDDYCGFEFTLDGYHALFALMQMAYADARAKNPSMPVHFISGVDDPCLGDHNQFARGVEAMRRCGYRAVTAKLYDGMRHEILNEPGRAEVYADIFAMLGAWQNQK